MNEKWIKVTMRMSISDLIIQFIHKITMDLSFQTSLGLETKYMFHRRVNHPVASMDKPSEVLSVYHVWIRFPEQAGSSDRQIYMPVKQSRTLTARNANTFQTQMLLTSSHFEV